ncbi:MAG: T9SS type A sorting domain-containing protein, partial [Bacteroidia bacterium]
HSTTAPFAILCIDTTGKQLWYKIYWGKRQFASGVAIDDDGNFLLGGGGYRGDGGAIDTFYKWTAKMDTSGNFIWEHKYEDSVKYGGGIPVVINGSYYWLGGKSNLNEIAYSFIMKTNRNGNTEWAKELIRAASPYTFTPVVNGLYSPVVVNGNIYTTGYEVESFDSGYTFKDFVILTKVDTLGNLKWKRRFSQWYKDNRAFSLTAVPDGFIICADGKDTTHTTGFTDAWIIKTDTNGCIVPGCHLTDGLVQITNPDAFVNVFPNPASDNITVQITDSRAKLKSYFLYDGKGNFITQQALTTNTDKFDINTQQLPTGNYYLVLELEQGQRATKKILIHR